MHKKLIATANSLDIPNFDQRQREKPPFPSTFTSKLNAWYSLLLNVPEYSNNLKKIWINQAGVGAVEGIRFWNLNAIGKDNHIRTTKTALGALLFNVLSGSMGHLFASNMRDNAEAIKRGDLPGTVEESKKEHAQNLLNSGIFDLVAAGVLFYSLYLNSLEDWNNAELGVFIYEIIAGLNKSYESGAWNSLRTQLGEGDNKALQTSLTFTICTLEIGVNALIWSVSANLTFMLLDTLSTMTDEHLLVAGLIFGAAAILEFTPKLQLYKRFQSNLT